MKAVLSHSSLLLVSRMALGTMFIVASIDKIGSPDAFSENVAAYGLIPYSLVNLFSLIVPWLELLCGAFLLGGFLIRPSSGLLTVLLGMFIVAMISALARELKIDCGCFGKEHASPVSWLRVLEDIGLLLLALHSYAFSSAPTPATEKPSG